MVAPGIDFVGTIPAELQFVQVFAAEVVKGAKEPEAAQRLIACLASDKATPSVEKTGMKRTQVRAKFDELPVASSQERSPSPPKYGGTLPAKRGLGRRVHMIDG